MDSFINIPPSWEERVIYYQTFDNSGESSPKNESAEINIAKIELVESLDIGKDGIHGLCAVPGKNKAMQLSSKSLSPHQPLTVSFWWRLLEDANKDSSFGLFHLTNGKGFVSNFVRTGPWCALVQPAGVLQVYYLPDIQNINGIYDQNILSNLELKAGVWHHTALVFASGSLVSAYTDGQKVYQIRLTGRSFNESDQLNLMILGNSGDFRVALDEIIILNRPLGDKDINNYYKAIKQMNMANWYSRAKASG